MSDAPRLPPDSSLPVTVLRHVDAVCRRFEDAWRQGRSPSLEEHLAGAADGERAALLRELLRLELQYRGTADAAEYECRFPEEAAVVRAVFAQTATIAPTPSAGDATPTSPDLKRGTAARFPAPPGYEIVGELGRGGMGVVYKARQIKANRVVALKMILGSRPADLAGRVRFQIEVEAIARLRHPHIVQLLEAGEHNGQPYFSLEFCDGGSLDRVLKARRPSPGEAAALVEKLARAVHSAHQRGVVHRDLKPANVLLASGGCEPPDAPSGGLRPPLAGYTPKITDFGLAKRTDADGQLSQSGDVLGTPSYMAPEQAEGRGREVGPATDVFALGALLYECFAGRPPFKGATAFDTIHKVLTEEPEPPSRLNPNVPRDLETICLKCLRKPPAERYASAEALAEDLRRYRAGEPITARPVGAAERALKWVRRRPAAASLVALAAALVGVVVISLGLISSHLHNENVALVQKEQEHQQRERAEQERTLARINALADAAPGAVPGLLAELEATRDEVLPRLRELWDEGDGGNPARRMRLGLALLPAEPDRVRDDLAGWLPQVGDPAEVVLFRDVLAPYSSGLRERFWTKAGDPAAKPEERFRALVALAAFDRDDKRWNEQARPAVAELLAQNPLHLGTWVPALRPVAAFLVPPLAEECRTAKSPERREYAATLLADYAADQPEALADLLLDADTPAQYDRLFPAVQGQAERAARRIREELALPTPDPDAPITPKGAAERDRLARRQATGAVTLLKLGFADDAWQVFRWRPDPEARSQLVHRAGLFGVDPKLLARRLADEPDVSSRRALIVALGEFPAERLPPDVRGPLTEQLLRRYRDDPDPGVHGAIDWLLRHGREGPEPRPLDWGQGAALRKIDAELAKRGGQPDGDRHWYVNAEGITMVCVRDPAVFRMGSPPSEVGRLGNEAPHRVAIGHNFAIAARPVTNNDFALFRKDRMPNRLAPDTARWSPAPNGPVVGVSWFEAAHFCNWLSEQDGLPEKEWCYPPGSKDDFKLGMRPYPDYLKRKGYRLPTEAEWEYAARAGAGSSHYYGNSPELLPRYAWFMLNAQNRAWPTGQKRPNDLGLFDMHGNVFNWIEEPMLPYRVARNGEPTPDLEDRKAVNESPGRGIRGGSFGYPAREVRSAYRLYDNPSNYNNMIGFRPARTLP
jgi:formylglycine-generating enzyme required for sulfatase activity